MKKFQTLLIVEHRFVICFMAIATGVFFRFSGINFDAGQHLHPDERFLTMVACSLEWPDSPARYFATADSPLNPANHSEGRFYVYGCFPLFMTKAVAGIAGTEGYDTLAITGRLLAACADSAVILLLFLMGKNFFSRDTGLLAAALYAVSVLPVQLSHFFTTDPFMNLFMAAALYFSMAYSRKPGTGKGMAAGIFWGMALASKISALCLAPVLLAASVSGSLEAGRARSALSGAAAIATACVTLRILDPYIFSGPAFWNLSINNSFINNLATLSAISRPLSGFPPSMQWAFTTPLLSALGNMASEGLGTAIFAAGSAGIIIMATEGMKNRQNRFMLLPALLVLSTAASLLFHPVQTMRYLLPAYPAMALAAAFCLLAMRKRMANAPFACWPATVVLTCGLIWALAFHSIYRHPCTRTEASRWIYDNVPSGSAIAVEQWDDPLPLAVDGKRPEQYRRITLNPAEKESPGKVDALVNRLEEADFMVIGSNRLYLPISRLKQLFPMTTRYYELLFGNLAGFTLVREFASPPSVGSVTFPDNDAEEAFTVYDHPEVFIFRKDKTFSARALKRELLLALETGTPLAETKRGGITPADPVTPVTERRLEITTRAGPLFLIRFISLMALLGFAGAQLNRFCFNGMPVPGRAVAAITAAFLYGLGIRYTEIGSGRILMAVFILLCLAAFLHLWRYDSHSHSPETGWNSLVFWSVFSFFLILRAHNPAIFWGERPMDFAILNAMTRTGTFPPVDPWISGFPLRYHGWGQFMIAVMGKMAGIPPEFLYNLGAAMVPAMAAELFFQALKLLAQSRVHAFAGTAMIFFSGNLSAWFLHPWQGGWTFSDFWQSSRIIPDTINEYPFWTAVFADLHGHFIGMIFSGMIVCGIALHLTTSGKKRICPAAFAGLGLGSMAVANPWAVPVYSLLLLLFAMALSLKNGAIFIATAAASAMTIALPFWSSPHDAAPIMWAENSVSLFRFLVIFGPFMFFHVVWTRRMIKPSVKQEVLALAAVAAALMLWPPGITISLTATGLSLITIWKKGRKQSGLPTHIFMLAATLTIAGCGVFTISDRMNTIFKFYFEAWILLSVAGATALGMICKAKKGYIGKSLSIIAAATMFLTPACALKAWWDNPREPSGRFTLDGLDFLRKKGPDIRKTVCRLNGFRGQPVVAEAFGPSYGPYARISSFTGLPTVIGWRHHVCQHGHRPQETEKRARDLRAFYEATGMAGKIAERYNIKYAVLGELERKRYGEEAGSDWKEHGLLPIFRYGKTEVWRNEKAF